MPEPDPFSPVEWPEVRAHLVKQLMIESAWLRDGEEGLIWQPGTVPVHVKVVGRGEDSDSGPFLVVSASMRVLDCPPHEAIDLARTANRQFLLGSFFWDDDAVHAETRVYLTANSRTSLSLFHVAVLAMATTAHELVEAAEHAHTVPPLTTEEEPLGRRQRPDELLGVFRGDVSELPGQSGDALEQAWQEVRPMLHDTLLSLGYEPGFTDSTVDFYVVGPLAVGVGFNETGKYGPGLDVMTIVTGELPPDDQTLLVNAVNGYVSSHGPAHVGNLQQQIRETDSSLIMPSYLPYAYLGKYMRDAQALNASMVNALGLVLLTGLTLYDALYPPQPQPGPPA